MQKTVLIIDDSDDDIVLTKLILEKLNREIRVDSAGSGEKGLALLRSMDALPSLVLLDLKMPGLDGFGVLREIRKDERLGSLPVIIVTHSDLESDKNASHANGANSYLNKSVDLDQFAIDMKKELERWVS